MYFIQWLYPQPAHLTFMSIRFPSSSRSSATTINDIFPQLGHWPNPDAILYPPPIYKPKPLHTRMNSGASTGDVERYLFYFMSLLFKVFCITFLDFARPSQTIWTM